VRAELRARIARLTPPVIPIEEGEVGDALAWALLFEHWPELVPDASVDPEAAFYNRYFWFKRFAALKQKRDGPDAGLEQQVFKMLDELEQLDFDPDWALLEQLDTEAGNVPG
jgi:hypothetical protein